MRETDEPAAEILLTAEGAAHALLYLSTMLTVLIRILKNSGAIRQEEIDAIIISNQKSEAPGADVVSFHMNCLLTGAQPPVFRVIEGGNQKSD